MQATDDLTPAQLKARAGQWFDRQCEISRLALGPRWIDLQPWIEAYPKQEIIERLKALGWRPKE